MRDLGGGVVGDDEAVVHQVGEHRGVLVVDHELVERRAPPDVVGPDTGLGQAQEDPACDVLLRGRQSRVHVVGEVRDRAVHATRRLVPLEREGRAVPAVPRLEQCGLEQRQRARFGSDVVEDPLDQPVLEHEARASSRLLDGPLQLVGSHRADQHVRPPEQLREGGVFRAARVVVGPHRREHPARGIGGVGRVHQDVEEPVAQRVVATHGEHLFELVDDDHQRPSPVVPFIARAAKPANDSGSSSNW